MRRLAIILNAARGDGTQIGTQVREACRQRSIDVHVEVVPGHELPAAAKRALDANSCTIVAGGGDGTISAVAGVVAGTPAALGVLPLGTLNHFARDLHIPVDLDEAIATVIDGDVRQVDVGDVNGHPFINNASVGLYPRLVWEREQRERQGHRKWAAAGAAAWTVWRRYRRVTVFAERDGKGPARVRTPFVFVGNNPYQLTGLNFGSRATLESGRLHVCMAPELSAMGVLGVLGATLAGRLKTFEQFESILTRALTIGAHRGRLGIALDGEILVLRTPLQFAIRPGVLRVRVPRQPPAA